MVNFKLKNKCSKNCAYCGCTPKNVMKNVKPTDNNKIKKCPATKPLHGLCRGMECTCRVGYRNRANVLKYDERGTGKITEREQQRIDRW